MQRIWYIMQTNLAYRPEKKQCKNKRAQNQLLRRYIVLVLPAVRCQLSRWQHRAKNCNDPVLKQQACSSISRKTFHCQGGAVFAATQARYYRKILITLIVAYQTICDYLDNLCDRAGCYDLQAFRQLHQVLIDALTPGNIPQDYYAFYPHKDDGGYLNQLLYCCQQCIEQLPSYDKVYSHVLWFASCYIDLQVYKHIDTAVREEALMKWALENNDNPEIKWQEFSAAAGSTLGIFALFELACHPDTTEEDSQKIRDDYFPWICGFHILLDYFIDQEEDVAGGDLNFTFYYKNEEDMMKRFDVFACEARQRACQSGNVHLVQLMLDGLPAMYLSDPKVKHGGKTQHAERILNHFDREAKQLYRLCHIFRVVTD